ncbi:hypothetical protein MMAS_10700 [Mycobacteroides abscessus subsp. massiliense CCUG 48898 = JCM 15300]|nr:hypothetical protein MMAS_10700 [Mycobacteroides abscessus subsp. massiliense CCUG 48898 = JCM 15300]
MTVTPTLCRYSFIDAGLAGGVVDSGVLLAEPAGCPGF